MTLLSVKNLRVTFDTEAGRVEAVRGVSFSLGRERLGIVGESGSGKTMTGRSVLRLIRPPGRIEADAMEFDGQDLMKLSERQMRALRGPRIAMVMQDPKYSLNPVMKVGAQLMEGLRQRDRLGHAAARAKAIAALEAVQIRDPARVMEAYPHELSGGMRQRVVLAAAIAAEPKLLIADEPTTALDVTVQAQIIGLLQDLQKRIGMAIVLITHDIGVVASMADQVAVMYAGSVVEIGEADTVLTNPSHPYTHGLLTSVPDLDIPLGSPFQGINGLPPDLSRLTRGCAFAERCTHAVEECGLLRPRLQAMPRGELAACLRAPFDTLSTPTRATTGVM